MRASRLHMTVVLLLLSACAPPAGPDANLLAPYVVSPRGIVGEMLALAEVRPGDVVYDLGSGDGRIVIEAARLGARGVGIELDPALVTQARENARRAHVEHQVEFFIADALTVDLHAATVVTLYLGYEANLKLRPRLREQLPKGARVVSYKFDMGDWAPTALTRSSDESSGAHLIYLWRIDTQRGS